MDGDFDDEAHKKMRAIINDQNGIYVHFGTDGNVVTNSAAVVEKMDDRVPLLKGSACVHAWPHISLCR
jgi:hypothetical protein